MLDRSISVVLGVRARPYGAVGHADRVRCDVWQSSEGGRNVDDEFSDRAVGPFVAASRGEASRPCAEATNCWVSSMWLFKSCTTQSSQTVSWRSVVLQPLQLCPSPFTRTPIQLKSISRHHTRGRHDCVAMIAAIDPDGPANRGSSDGRKAPIAARISASLQPNTRSTDRKCARSTSTARSLPGLL